MNVVWFLISFGLFIAGLWLFVVAFNDYSTALFTFTGGILLISASMYLPFHILGRSEQR